LTAKEVGERILKELREERRREDAIREITEWEADPLNPKWRAESCRR
jgi:hypothetical protein